MTIQTFNPQENFKLTLTADAGEFFNKQLATEEATAIRLSVKKSGCTGYAYTIDPVNEAEAGDLELELEGVRLFISETAKPMINGSEIVLAKQGLSKVIDIQNPNITESCGCGSSFLVD